MNLDAWQGSFVAALTATQADEAAGLAVYRNGLRQACSDAIEANFPAVAALVGREWLRAAAAIYREQTLPRDVALIHYGADFVDFLRAFAPARDLPWLPPVAALDRAWLEAFCARDMPPAQAAALTALSPDAWSTLVLRPHPAARWLHCAEHPVATLWLMNRGFEALPVDGLARIAWHGEALLLSRPCAAVRALRIDPAVCSLLDDCAAGLPLAVALARLIDTAPALDAASTFAALLNAGAYAPPHAINAEEE